MGKVKLYESKSEMLEDQLRKMREKKS